MRYFRERHDDGVSYYEFDGEWVKRQIIVEKEVLLLLQELEACDIPLSKLGFSSKNEISVSDFNEVWCHYSEHPHGTKREDHPLVKQLLQDLKKWDG